MLYKKFIEDFHLLECVNSNIAIISVYFDLFIFLSQIRHQT